MADTADRAIPKSFRVVCIVALIWNGMGVVNFFVQMDPEMLASYRASERALIDGRPVWATVGFALAVFGGTIGSVLLLLRRPSAFYLFIVSMFGVIVTMSHALGAGIDFGAGEIAGIILMPMVVAVFLVWYSRYAKRQGWIGLLP